MDMSERRLSSRRRIETKRTDMKPSISPALTWFRYGSSLRSEPTQPAFAPLS